ncbi:hypothetical protein [Bacillus velezensis]|uniref:hypothetical protein n=1 Tax=Bacillus velezensis TaxID=492670 RepID=UPI001E546874|nr:hypothetical protein [Bacillus velezensis]
MDKKDSNLNRISYEFSLLPMQNICPVIEDKIFNAAPYPYLNIIYGKRISRNNMIKQNELGMVWSKGMGRENKLELKRIQNFNLDHLRFAHGLEITNATSGFWLYTVYVLRVDWLSNPLC